MASKSVLYITVTADSGLPAQTLKETLCKPATRPRVAVTAIAAYLERLVGGSGSAVVHVALAGPDTGTAGTCTIACVQASAAVGDTINVGDTRFTVVAATGVSLLDGYFSRGGTNTECAANLAAAINGHPALRGSFTATSAIGTVTITAASKGSHANLLNLSTSKPAAFTVTSPVNGAKGTLVAELRGYRCG